MQGRETQKLLTIALSIRLRQSETEISEFAHCDPDSNLFLGLQSGSAGAAFAFSSC